MKNVVQRLIAILLAVVMLSSTCLEAFADGTSNAGNTGNSSFEDDPPASTDNDNVLTLPASLKAIEAEAFYGDSSVTEVVIPYGATSINAKAFAYSGVNRITIPDTVTEISEDAFEGTEGLTIIAAARSFAREYAADNKIKWENDDAYYVNEQARYIMSLTDGANNLESIVPEDLDFSLVSSDGITDDAMLKIIEVFNTHQIQQKDNYDAYLTCLDEIVSSFDWLTDDLIDTGLSVNEDGTQFQLANTSYALSGSLANLFSNDFSIQSSSLLENGDTQLVILSDGKIYTVVGNNNGITVLDPDNENVEVASLRSVFSFSLDTISTIVNDFRTIFTVGIQDISMQIDAGIKSMEKLIEVETEIGTYIENNRGTVKPMYQQKTNELRLTSNTNLIRCRATLSALRKAAATVSGFAAIWDTLNIVEDSNRLMELEDIKEHGHPTAQDHVDPAKLEIATQMQIDIDRAQMAYAADIVFAAIQVGTDIASFISNLAMLIPGGQGAGIAARLGIWGTIAAARGIQASLCLVGIVSSGLADTIYNYVIASDPQLHGPIEGGNETFLYGAVTDSQTNNPISDVIVTLTTSQNGSFTTTTDANGRYSFTDVPNGTHNISFVKTYYDSITRSITMNLSGDTTYNAAMTLQSEEYVPQDAFDPAFWTWCVNQFDTKDHYNANTQKWEKDGKLSRTEVLAVKGVYCSNQGFSSIKGVRFFANLEDLECDNNSISTLDVGNLAKLQSISCYNNDLTTLDLRGLPSLRYLSCEGNNLTKLDISGLSQFQRLYCNIDQMKYLNASGCQNLSYINAYNSDIGAHLSSGQLIELNFSGCAALKTLDCSFNQIQIINVSGCTALQTLKCYNNQVQTLNMEGCTSLQELSCSNNLITTLNVSGLTSLRDLSCYNNQLQSLRVSGNRSLKSLSCSSNQLQSLSVSGCTSLQSLSCGSNQLQRLNMTGCTALSSLSCGDNQLTVLDISICPGLEWLSCENNQLRALYVKDYASLERLDCTNNNLSSLDVSGCINLNSLDYDNNPMTRLNASGCASLYSLGKCNENTMKKIDISGCTSLSTFVWSGSDEPGILTSLKASGCSSLGWMDCSNNQLTSIDVSGCTSLYNLDCSNNRLITLNASGCTSLKTQLSFSDNESLTDLDLSGCTALSHVVILEDSALKHANLAGCTSLKQLSFYSKPQLEDVNVRGCTSLTSFSCSDSQLTSLDLTQCTSLTQLICCSDQLTTLDVTQCKELTYLNCGGNKLTRLDVTNCSKLKNLYCDNNQLTDLDISKCKDLEILYCSDNNLGSLDASNCPLLEHLYCYNCQLSSLDISTCSILEYLTCNNNHLKSLDVRNCSKLLEIIVNGSVSIYNNTISYGNKITEGEYTYLRVHLTIDATTNLITA